MISNARFKVATGPTIEHPASPRIISISAEIIASSSTISTRRPASPMTVVPISPQPALLFPPDGKSPRPCSVGPAEDESAHRNTSNCLPGILFRTQRDSQIDPQPALVEFDPRLSAEAMAHLALDQSQAEAMPWRLPDRRPATLDPVQHQAVLAALLDRPGDFERSAGHGERTVFHCVGSELVQHHPERQREFRLERYRRTFDDQAIAAADIGLDLLAHEVDEGDVAPLVARHQLVG